MKTRIWIIGTVSLALSSLITASLSAGVILPSAATINFNGVTAFDTSGDPLINVATGDRITGLGGVVNLTAVGEVTVIYDSADTENLGTPAADMTFLLNAVLTPNGNPTELSSSPNSRTYLFGSTLTGGTLQVFDDGLTGGTQDLNTSILLGNPVSIPASATDGDLYIDGDLSNTSGFSTLIVTYSRPNESNDFDTISLDLLTLITGEYDIVGGTILSALDGAGRDTDQRQPSRDRDAHPF